MRWFVEISPLGTKSGQEAILCVEAPQWQPALQKARALRSDNGALSNFSIELLEDGYRAVDPTARLRYVVKRAPDDAPLTNGGVSVPPPATTGGGPSSPPARPALEKPVTSPPPAEPELKKRAPALTMAFASSGSAHISPVEDLPRVEPVAPEPPTPAPVSVKPLHDGPASGPKPRAPEELLHDGAASGPKPRAPAEPLHDGAASGPKPRAPAEPLPSFVLVGSREDNPSESSPLTYREYVYAVGEGTSEADARRLIFDRFEHVRGALDPTPTGKLINLAVFDHVFHGRPQRRPLVTLTWKDWKGDEPELRFPHREAPSEAPPPPAPEPAAVAPAPVVPATLVPTAEADPAAVASPPTHPDLPAQPVASPPTHPDPPSPPAQQVVEVPSEPAPAGQSTAPASRRLAGDDLLSELFEAFGDLHFARDSLEGAEFVLNLTLEKLPSEVGLVSLFDMNKREFVIVRQSGGPRRALGARQAERAPLAITAMRKRRAIVVADAAEAGQAMDDRWRAIGIELKSLVCAPIELNGRFLGLIELANPSDGHAFDEGDGNALTYIGQQFAEFVAAHGVIVDEELIVGEEPAPPRSSTSIRAPSASRSAPPSKKGR